MWRPLPHGAGALAALVGLLGLPPLAGAALPPGNEDELYCPDGYCVRPKARRPGFTGKQSSMHECVRLTTLGSTEEVVKAVTPWGSKSGHSAKTKLLDKGYSTRTCNGLVTPAGEEPQDNSSEKTSTKTKPAKEKPAKAAGKGGVADFNCTAGHLFWEKDWSLEKKQWCCDQGLAPNACEVLGVSSGGGGAGDVQPGVTSSTAPSAAADDSTTGSTTAEAATPEAAKPEDAKAEEDAAPGTCDSECEHDGQTATCRYRVDWVSSHKYGGQATACALAHAMVQGQCPSCAGCQLANLGCAAEVPTTPAPAPTTPSTTEAPKPSSTKILGCDSVCEYEGQTATCKERVLYAAANEYLGEADGCASAHILVLYQCPNCFSCAAAHTGCVAVMETSTSLVKTSTTTTMRTSPKHIGHSHHHAKAALEDKSSTTAAESTTAPADGTTASADDYDCMEGFFGWKKAWSDDKKAYCCQAEGKGCEDSGASKGHQKEVSAASLDQDDDSELDSHPLIDEDESPEDEELFEYNCTAELDNWEVGWSTPKKAWCCEQRQVGCPVEASEARLEEKYDRLAAVPAWWERGRSPPQGPLGRLGRVPVFTALAAGLAVLASLTAVVLARQGLCRQGGGLPGLQRQNYVELEVPIAP